MKYALACCLLVAIAWQTAYADEAPVEEFDLLPIKSIEEIEGHWTIAPEGVGMFSGNSLDIKDKRGEYRQFTDTPPPDFGPIQFDVELASGVLVLKTNDPNVEAKKWHLAQLGKHKCLVAITTGRKGHIDPTPFQAYAPVLYFRPRKGAAKPEPALPTRNPPPRKPSQLRSGSRT